MSNVPEFIDKWRVISVLGEGSFGQVYCVQDRNNKVNSIIFPTNKRRSLILAKPFLCYEG